MTKKIFTLKLFCPCPTASCVFEATSNLLNIQVLYKNNHHYNFDFLASNKVEIALTGEEEKRINWFED